jgi:hypothetical protein
VDRVQVVKSQWWVGEFTTWWLTDFVMFYSYGGGMHKLGVADCLLWEADTVTTDICDFKKKGFKTDSDAVLISTAIGL